MRRTYAVPVEVNPAGNFHQSSCEKCELERGRGAAVAAQEVFPLVEIRRDGDIEKTHHHLLIGLLASADLPVGIGVMWVLA